MSFQKLGSAPLILLALLFLGDTPCGYAVADRSCGRRMQIEGIMRDNYAKEDGFIFMSDVARPHEWRSFCFSFACSKFRWVESARIAEEQLRKIGVEPHRFTHPTGQGIVLMIHKSAFEDPT